MIFFLKTSRKKLFRGKRQIYKAEIACQKASKTQGRRFPSKVYHNKSSLQRKRILRDRGKKSTPPEMRGWSPNTGNQNVRLGGESASLFLIQVEEISEFNPSST